MSLIHWLKDSVAQNADVPVSTSTPMPVQPTVGTTAVSSSAPLPVTGAVQPLITSTDWHYSTAAGAATITNTTTAVTIKTAAGTGLYNTISYITVSADTLGTATVLSVRDGAGGTVLWAIRMQATAQTTQHFTFPTPLIGSANTLLEILTQTASTGGVYVSAGGGVVG